MRSKVKDIKLVFKEDPKIFIQRIRRLSSKDTGLWLIMEDGNILGLLERSENFNKNEKKFGFWKAFLIEGDDTKIVGSFHDVSSLPDDGETNFSGWQGAVRTIVEKSRSIILLREKFKNDGERKPVVRKNYCR